MFNSKQEDSDTVVSYWISYTDILASLLIIILLTTAYLISKIGEKVNENENVRKEMLLRIEKMLNNSGIPVYVAENQSVLRIPHSVLTFQSNKFIIPSEMKKNLDKIGKTIIDEIKKNNLSDSFETVFIEGHTDNIPSNLPKGNMGLSTFRAISVWEHWISRVSDDFQTLNNTSGEKLFSVSGYGETRPIQKDQSTPNRRRQNRRIDIRFTIHNPDIF